MILNWKKIHKAKRVRDCWTCKTGFRPFWNLTFRQETFLRRHFIIDTFLHVHVSALQLYRHMNISSLWHRDFLAQWFFSTMDVSAQGHFGRWTFWSSSTGAYCLARCQNIYVTKCSGAEISRSETSVVPKIYLLCQNLSTLRLNIKEIPNSKYFVCL